MNNWRSLGEIKAEPMETSQLDKWLEGKIPRRMLAIPFGGPIPGAKAPLGVDMDGEWFDSNTDLVGGYKALLGRERLMDFHHGSDPTGVMKGAILGRVVRDEQPEADGYWVDFWANAGERRLALVAQLEERGAKLYGSSEAIPGAVKVSKAGHIDVWPWVRQTVSTSPQNTYAVMPPLKALLDVDLDTVGVGALKAYLSGLGDLEHDPRPTSRSKAVASGEQTEIEPILEELMGEFQKFIHKHRSR
jgi:hypothetical protein